MRSSALDPMMLADYDTIREKPLRFAISGYMVAALALAGISVGVAGLVTAAPAKNDAMITLCSIVIAVSTALLGGITLLSPNEAAVLQLFGRYVGTVRSEGLTFITPFVTVTKISTRARTFESSKLKVNDKDGNPIEIAAIITWKVSDTAQATFAVEHYVQYVHVQTEAALRDLAMHYSYDAVSDSPDVVSLRGSADHVSARLEEEVQKRLRMAGVELLSARISHLAYAPEIAQAMLQRQQAGAIIGARRQIVAGACGIVETALTDLRDRGVVELSEEKKSALASNLLIVLCGESRAQPVINTSA